LTRLPIGRIVPLDAGDVARGAALFPLVGAGLGAVAGLIADALYPTLPAFPAAGVAVAVAVLLTGALHVDALADTFDAVGATTRERALEIMRDSRVGSFGATAIALDLLLKVGAVASLVGADDALPALVVAGALSRAVSPPLAAVLPYARIEGGPGSVLSGRISKLAAAVAVGLGCVIAITVEGSDGALLIGVAAAVAVCTGSIWRRWLGGATGDTLGATTELCETIVLLVAVALA
jgi:adenosylcobinamide-GDP ribazoletransferase